MKSTRRSVLFIDDEPEFLNSIKLVMRGQNYNIITEDNPMAALEIIQKLEIAVVISDVHMPVLSGIELQERIVALNKNTYRIMLSGSSKYDTALEAINKGSIEKFLCKPIVKSDLLLSISQGVQIYNLRVENESYKERIEDQNNKMIELQSRILKGSEREDAALSNAARMQQDLIIDEPPKAMKYVSMCSMSMPAQYLGGDILLFNRYSETLMDFVVGDVMGKGPDAAIIGAALSNRMRYEWGRQDGSGGPIEDIGQIMANVCAKLETNVLKHESFISMFYGRLDTQRRSLDFIGCGCEPVICLKGQETSIIAGENTAFGILPEQMEHVVQQYELQENESLVFTSDGFADARRIDHGDRFGYDRLTNSVASSAHCPPVEMARQMVSDVREFSDRLVNVDDLSVFILKLDQKSDADLDSNPDLEKVERSYQSNPTDAKKIRSFLKKYLSEYHKEFIDKVQLAVQEAFVNIIRHAYLNQQDLPVVLRVGKSIDGIIVELLDYGLSLQIDEVSDPDFTGNSPSGFGVYMIKELTDDVTIGFDHKARNAITMKFNKGVKE
ncbi:MAG: SpoIIE family protein phosphatase [Planctomycetes bacterium]|nr:SpoIIE family protein phosphatase [Planctomycetota bacterium]